MKRIANLLSLLTLVSVVGCGPGSNGELTGVPGRRPWFHPQPYGTIYVPTGTFHTGQSDQDIFQSYLAPNKQVSIAAFWMDDTEITNNEYRQFVYHVIDSIARFMIGEEPYLYENEATGKMMIDYSEELVLSDPELQETLEPLYYIEEDRFWGKRQIDVRKLYYEYEIVDQRMAANDPYAWGPDPDIDMPKVQQYQDEENGTIYPNQKVERDNPLNEETHDRTPRSKYVKKKTVLVYPDTLAFIRDFTYSFNDPMTEMYFWHPKYDDYPVVGVTWHQANAFCAWRGWWLNKYYDDIKQPTVNAYRLPTEYEWEYAARGGRDGNKYPWGGPYTRNSKGCFLANFKPNRGNYIDDGGMYPVRADSYFPNDYGLYNMAGNVSEWTSTAYTTTNHLFTHDLNPDYQLDVPDDHPEISRKRKVIRGGSWKDVAYFIENGSRTYEYQDSAKSYVGFRCVMTFIGRSIRDKE